MARPDYAETRIVDHVEPGRHEYTAVSHDHNYRWYEVRGENGTVGYLIAGIAVLPAHCGDPYRDPT